MTTMQHNRIVVIGIIVGINWKEFEVQQKKAFELVDSAEREIRLELSRNESDAGAHTETPIYYI